MRVLLRSNSEEVDMINKDQGAAILRCFHWWLRCAVFSSAALLLNQVAFMLDVMECIRLPLSPDWILAIYSILNVVALVGIVTGVVQGSEYSHAARAWLSDVRDRVGHVHFAIKYRPINPMEGPWFDVLKVIKQVLK